MTFMPRGNDPSLTFKAIYDAWNRLIRVEDGASNAVVASYEHDGLNRRIVKRTTETRHYYYSDQWQVVEEDVEQSQRQELATAQYVWGLRYIDDLIVYDRIGEGQRLFGLQDANWNVVALLDDAGAVQERYLYEPYGKVEFQDADFVTRPAGSALANPYTYTARRFDEETGLYYYRNRCYHTELGRFVSRDPIGFRGSPWNLYEYGAGRPTGSVDPRGLETPWSPIGAGSGFYDWGHGLGNREPVQIDPATALAADLGLHWFTGRGERFTRGSDALMSQETIRIAVRNELEALNLQLCRDGKTGKGFAQRTLKPQPENRYLIQTTNVPSHGLRMDIRYAVSVKGCCCIATYEVSYRWLDRADLHPERHTFPDLILGILPVGQEFWIDIRWKSTYSRRIPLMEGACAPQSSGWPSRGFRGEK
jgi:RHS repeat-associated protein